MSDKQVNLEINGVPLQARKGAMVIEVADEANIDIPRFCYHKKLSIAANCRMCLVQVEKMTKAVPACATPVAEGMKVFTRSPEAIAAQKATMEFLLINHPLDCPICDQGGECELQDIAMGYGEDVSRYTESKRVVRDKDIGPLISTDMTRCIHCTRCVRFGTEVAGVRELGATGRGEFLEIGTYVEKSLTSEMSGNVIDLCPVGALNAKPSRMAARAWELIQHATVASHDAVGSNLYLHTLRGRVIRAVPRENEDINETWLSDRDRFSYSGLYSDDRLERPMAKVEDKWRDIDWDDALTRVAERLREFSPQSIGVLMGANATLEELYLLQKLMRGIGVQNIDHRLRQVDFSDQALAPLFPWLGQSVADLESLNAALLVGSNIRKEQPIAAHRLRKACLKGAQLMAVNPRDFDFVFDLSEKLIVQPMAMVEALAGIAKASLKQASVSVPLAFKKLLTGGRVEKSYERIAKQLHDAERASILIGPLAEHHPHFSQLRALATLIAEHTGARLGYLPVAANSVGAWLAGVLPHRLPGGQENVNPGLNAKAMLAAPLKAYVLFGVEPEYDCDNPTQAQRAMEAAEFVVAFSPFASDNTKSYAHMLLPVGTFAETSGTFVNAEGQWQSFEGAAGLPGEASPGWKLLRVLGNKLNLEGFAYLSSREVRDELQSHFSVDTPFDNRIKLDEALAKPKKTKSLIRASEVPMYSLDSLVRRSSPLQQTPDAQPAAVYLHEQQAQALDFNGVDHVIVKQEGTEASLPLIIDNRVPVGCAWIPSGLSQTASLASGIGEITLHKG